MQTSEISRVRAPQQWGLLKPARWLVLSGLLIFKFLLDWSHTHFVSKYWSYSGFESDIDSLKLAESYFWVIALGSLIPAYAKRPSQFFCLLFAVTIIVPLLSLYAMQNEESTYLYMVLIGFGILLLFSYWNVDFAIPVLAEGRTLAWALVAGLTSYTYGWLIVHGGLSSLNFSLTEVYILREQNVEKFSGLINYTATLQGKVVNAFLFAYFLWTRRWKSCLLVVAAQILLFGMVGHKSYLFNLLLVAFAYLCIDRSFTQWALVFAASAMTLGFVAFFLWTENKLLASLFVRRVLFTTAENHYAYYYFFSERPPMLLSNSILSGFMNYPYPLNPPRLISIFRYGHAETHINTGFLATGFMHFHFVGILLYSCIVGILFKVIDTLSRHRLPMWFGIALTIISVWSLRSGDLGVVLSTHGLGLAILILWFFQVPNRQLEHKPVASP